MTSYVPPCKTSSMEMASQLTEATGREITYVDVPETAMRGTMLRLGVPSGRRKSSSRIMRTTAGEKRRSSGLRSRTLRVIRPIRSPLLPAIKRHLSNLRVAIEPGKACNWRDASACGALYLIACRSQEHVQIESRLAARGASVSPQNQAALRFHITSDRAVNEFSEVFFGDAVPQCVDIAVSPRGCPIPGVPHVEISGISGKTRSRDFY